MKKVKISRTVKWSALALLLGCGLSALACMVAVPTGPCADPVDAACDNNCTGYSYSPDNSYCDSRDGATGGTDCSIQNVACQGTKHEYDIIDDGNGHCLGCGDVPWDFPTADNGSANIAVVTGSCSY